MCSERESSGKGGDSSGGDSSKGNDKGSGNGDDKNIGGSNGSRLGNPGGAKKTPGGNAHNKNSRTPAGAPSIPPIRKGRKRVKPLDARALENLLRWSIDLGDRQQNLLKTALEIVTDDSE